MGEITVKKCHCDTGFENGVILKNIQEKDFEIYGKLIKNNYIVIKYRGKLLEQYINKTANSDEGKIYLAYYFNNDITTLKTIEFTKCMHSNEPCFCISLDLEENNFISFYFMNFSGTIDNNEGISYKYEIVFDPIKKLMEKYAGIENKNLPEIFGTKNSFIKFFSSLLEKIKKRIKINT